MARVANIPERLMTALAERYRLEREVGAGGMATVYLALDVRHDRKVAVKVLRPELAASLGQERFLREIAIAARLQHPHILALYDSGHGDGFLFYVMPFVEGTSLREKLIREGELPIHEAVRILRDVADAMAYAHEHGIVHRDIKPENVMLSGRHALVADFGVAKAIGEAAHGGMVTSTGIALGTPTYMSPEQAAADPHADHRADIYAFGVLTYELLAGRPPFVASSPQALLAMQMTEEPVPVTVHRPNVPPGLAAMVMHCLQKRPADRIQSAEELALQLEAVLTPSAGLTPTATQPARVAGGSVIRRYRYPAIAGGVIALVAGAIALMPAGGIFRKADDQFTGLHRATPTQLTYDGNVTKADLSPDGQLLAYVSSLGGERTVWVQDLGGGAPIRIATQPSDYPSEGEALRWSPDGSSLMVVAEFATIYPRLGGAPRFRLPNLGYTAWSPDGTSIAFWGQPSSGPLAIIQLASGKKQLFDSPDSSGFRLDGDWSPSAEYIVYAFAKPGPPERWALRTLRLGDSTEHTILVDSVPLSWARWSSSGDMIYYVRKGDLWTLPMRPDGTPRAAPHVLHAGAEARAVTVTKNGRRVAYLSAKSDRNLWVVPAGRAATAQDPLELTRGTAWNQGVPSPDGTRVAYMAFTQHGGDLFLIPVSGGPSEQLTSGHEGQSLPAWSPDGSALAFTARAQGVDRIRVLFLKDRTERRFEKTELGQSSPIWAPGARILYQRPGNRNWRFLDPQSGAEQPLVTNDSVGWMFSPEYSPDGQTVAISWNRKNAPGLWLIGVRDGSQRKILPPRHEVLGWSPDAAFVYAQERPEGKTLMVPVDGSGKTRPFDTPIGKTYDHCLPFQTAGTLRFLCGKVRRTSDVWMLETPSH